MFGKYLRRTERGASAVEYGLLITAIAAAIVLIVFFFGENLVTIFSDTCQGIADQTPNAADDCV